MNDQHATLYRKYRPQNFKQVKGQSHIVESLQAALKNKNIAHAYLFHGSRGLGKTSLARIFARQLEILPDDIYEIDAASNRGIDDVRTLRNGVRTLPLVSPYKMYIIDEVHMLTKDAFNALLKTLEEPPAHVLFILATTELHKVLPTIISRCQVFSFARPSIAVLQDHLIDIAAQEGSNLQPAAATLLARFADGSFRDALGALQKVLSVSSDKQLSVAEVESITGAPSEELIQLLVKAIALKDSEKIVTCFAQLREKTYDPRLVFELVIDHVRAILLLRFAPKQGHQALGHFNDADLEVMKDLSLAAGKNVNASLLRLLLQAYRNIKFSPDPLLLLELAIIEHCT